MPIVIPEAGESITEGILLQWFAKDGVFVQEGESLFEVETDKITLPIAAERSGILSILVPEGETVEIGQQVGTLQPGRAETTEEPRKSKEQHGEYYAEGVMMPAARFAASSAGVSTDAIEGTGKGGRVRKEDVQNHLAQKQAQSQQPTMTTQVPAPSPKQGESKANPPQSTTERQRREKMTPIRKRIAQRLVEAQHTAAILTTFNEVDMTQSMKLRKAHQDVFVERYGVKLGFMSIFVKAVVQALKEVPALNAYIDGDEIVYNQFYDIGI
ncbi:MAG: 2-oxo acid dehydrogenase subunit E2, partial [Myxococcota bacterium]